MNSEVISVPGIFVISSFFKKKNSLVDAQNEAIFDLSLFSLCSHYNTVLYSSAIRCSLRLAMASNAVIAKAILKFPPVSAEALSAVLQLLSSPGSRSLVSLFILSQAVVSDKVDARPTGST